MHLEWNRHGESAFQYETLEQLEDDLTPMSIPDLLKEKRTAWAAKLGAPILL